MIKLHDGPNAPRTTTNLLRDSGQLEEVDVTALSQEILQTLKKRVGAEHMLGFQEIQQKLIEIFVDFFREVNARKYTGRAKEIIDNVKNNLTKLLLLNEVAQHAAGVTIKTAKELGIEVEEKPSGVCMME